MSQDMTRRAWITTAMAGALLPPAMSGTEALAQAAAVDPNEPPAKALGYVTESPTPDAKCSNCALFQGKAGDAQGGCTLFQGRKVQAAGWCKGWTKKA